MKPTKQIKTVSPNEFIEYLEELKRDKYITYEAKITVLRKPTETETGWYELYFTARRVDKMNSGVNIEFTIKVFTKKEFNIFKKTIAFRLKLKNKAKKHDKSHVD